MAEPPLGPTHIKDLVADPANRRKHNPRNIGMVVDALHQVGAARSIVIDEDNVILAGNGVTEAAAEAGITKVRVIEARRVFDPYAGSGSTLIACEQSQRECLAVEIDAAYCQVVIDRWEAFTGLKATKVAESRPRLRKKSA